MTADFDQHEINHQNIAIEREMSHAHGARRAGADTVFIGGPPASRTQLQALVKFSFDRNCQVIRSVFGEVAEDGPISFECIATDGLTKAVGLTDGRLWKRDRRSPAILIFGEARSVVRLDSKGKLVLRDAKGRYAPCGYDLAREAVRTRAQRRPGKIPVLLSVGTLPAVTDVDTMVAIVNGLERASGRLPSPARAQRSGDA